MRLVWWFAGWLRFDQRLTTHAVHDMVAAGQLLHPLSGPDRAYLDVAIAGVPAFANSGYSCFVTNLAEERNGRGSGRPTLAFDAASPASQYANQQRHASGAVLDDAIHRVPAHAVDRPVDHLLN